MGHVGPLEKNLNFFVSLGITEILEFLTFLSFLFILKLSYSKPVRNILNYASTANIEELMKFYNLGDKTFETALRKLFNRQLFGICVLSCFVFEWDDDPKQRCEQ